jgi:hypothetical protein
MLCIAKQYDGDSYHQSKNIAYALRLSEVATGDIIGKLILRHLIDVNHTGQDDATRVDIRDNTRATRQHDQG